jgi:hypothetical protein
VGDFEQLRSLLFVEVGRLNGLENTPWFGRDSLGEIVWERY